MNRRQLLERMREILSLPTASFMEHEVRNRLAALGGKLGLPAEIDSWGNLHITYKKGRCSAPQILLAHMDHPGFIVTEDWQNSSRSEGFVWCRWFGRVREEYFAGGKIRIHTPEGPVPGIITSVRSGGKPRRVEWIRVRVAGAVSRGDFGSWDLPACRVRGDRLSAASVDDLVGCGVLACLLEVLVKTKARAWVEVIFTRAEEAGLVGATALARARIIPPDSPVIALETSKALPGARLGLGPVIRTGDKASCFDPGICALLTSTAVKLARTRRSFQYQRCLMDGGTTEASSFAAWGYKASGLAFPMLNYHNMGKRGIATEVVDVNDLLNGLCLLEAYLTAPWPRTLWPQAASRDLFTGFAATKPALLKQSSRHALVHWPQGPGRNT